MFVGKVALVTGGARGIGRAAVERLAEAGARVLLTDWSERRGAETAAELTARGLDVSFQHHDAGDEDSWSLATATALERYGALHVLVNNAYSGVARPFEELSTDDLRAALRVNLEGALIGTRLAGELMVEGGAVVNLASVAAFSGAPMNAGYAAAKSGLISLTRSAAVRFGARTPPIRVNAVAPGVVHTPTLENMVRALSKLPRDADVGPALADYARGLPLRRVGDPREIGAVIAFLASEQASYITGQCIVVDGGMMAAGGSGGRAG